MDFQKIDLKKEVSNLKKLSGKERGEDIKYLVSYIKKNKGEEGFKKVKAELNKIGYNLPNIDKIDNIEWIPVSLPNIFLVACVKIFNLKEEDIIEMGRKSLSFKSIFRFYIKYFLSFKKTITKASNSWDKHYSFGKIEIVKCNDKKKILIVRLKDFKVHQFTYIYFQGVFSQIIRIALGNKEIKSEKTKYALNGNFYYEYIFKWN